MEDDIKPGRDSEIRLNRKLHAMLRREETALRYR